jgi:hypothetical protein
LETYLGFLRRSAVSRSQADAICFDRGSPFELVPSTPLLHKKSPSGLSGGPVNSLRSCLLNSQPKLRVAELLNCSPVFLQGSVLGPLPLSAFTNDLCDSINYSRYPLVADDV